jgi:hypothetical protein
MTDERCLWDPYFWETFGPLFRDENEIIEFSMISGIPAEHIRERGPITYAKSLRTSTPATARLTEHSMADRLNPDRVR